MLRTKWHELPHGIGSEHVFAIGDIHGHSIPLRDALDAIARIPQGSKPRHLIFIGDTIDRGPDNIGAAKLVQNAKRIAKVDKVTRLLGNHEILLKRALASPEDELMFWSILGGTDLISEIPECQNCHSDREIARLVAEKMPSYLLGTLDRRPSHCIVDDCVFVHAGLSPHMNVRDFLTLGALDDMPGNLHWAWIRKPFLEARGGWAIDKPVTVVHGHSPAIKGLYADTSEIESSAMLHETHGRINLDADAGYATSQISMAEFLDGSYRIHLFQNEDYIPRPDPSDGDIAS